MVDTAQNRTKVWLSTYWIAGHITKDDAVTLASTVLAFDWPDYPIGRLFLDKDYNGVVSVGQASSTPLIDSDHFPVGYAENVPITLVAIDKPGVTATKLLEKMEAELRRVAETYPLGSVRKLTKTAPKTQRVGGSFFIFMHEYGLAYKRDLS